MSLDENVIEPTAVHDEVLPARIARIHSDWTLTDRSDSYMTRALVMFSNGRGASVIRGERSYGGPQGLYELGVVDENGVLDYSTPITDDVLGYLTEDDVMETLEKIAALPPEIKEVEE